METSFVRFWIFSSSFPACAADGNQQRLEGVGLWPCLHVGITRQHGIMGNSESSKLDDAKTTTDFDPRNQIPCTASLPP